MEDFSSTTTAQRRDAGSIDASGIDAAAQLEAMAQGLQQTGFQQLLRQLASDLIASRFISHRPPQCPAQWPARP